MKTSEFIKKIKALGYGHVHRKNRGVILVKRNEYTLVTVETKKVNHLDSNYGIEIPTNLFSLVVDYATTPVKDREDEPEYYLRILIRGFDSKFRYLNYRSTGVLTLSTQEDSPNFTTRATKAEWEELTGYTWEQLMRWFKEEPYKEEE